MHADPSQQHGPRDDRERQQDVQRADLIRKVVGQNPPHEADGDHCQEQVDGVRVGHSQDLAAVAADEEEGEVEAPKVEEARRAVEHERPFFEGGPFDERPGPARRETRAVEGDCQYVGQQHDEAADADRPGEADPGKKLLDDDWEDHAAGAGPHGGDADDQCSFADEVGADEGHCRAEMQTIGDSEAKAL